MVRAGAVLVAVVTSGVAVASAQPAPDAYLARLAATVQRRLDELAAGHAPKLVPPKPVAVRWKAARVGSLDLGAPLIAMTAGDLDGDGASELYVVTTREVVAFALRANKPVELGRVAFAGDRAVPAPRDAVGTAVVQGTELVAASSGWAQELRVSLAGKPVAQPGEAPGAGFLVCANERWQLAPGRNYFVAGGTFHGVRCQSGLVDRAGTPLRVRAQLAITGKLGIAVERCARTGACEPAGAYEYANAGTAFEIADVDRDGTPAGLQEELQRRRGRPRGARDLAGDGADRDRGGPARGRDAHRSVEARLRLRSTRAAWLLALATQVAHAETRPRYGGTVEASLLGAPVTLDPSAAETHAELTVVDLVFDTLYRVGPAGQPQPHLAAGPPVLDATRTRLTIPLREGVRFHDGTLLVVADVVASLERVRGTAARWTLAPIATITAGTAALELTLRAPATAVDITALLALPATAITKEGKPPTLARAIGSGAFAIEAFDRPRKRLRLKAHDAHFAGRPYLDHLVLSWYDAPDGEAKRFETGAAQLSARGVGAFARSQPKFRADDVEGPASLLVFVGFGRTHADVTAERGFRKALDLAIARDALKAVTSGERVVPAREPVPTEAGGPSLTAAARTGDLQAAQAALADAAKRVRALAPDRLPQLRLEILVEDTRPDDREIAERIVRALDKLGIASGIVAAPAPAFRDRVARGATDLWIGQYAVPVTATALWWSAAFAIGGDDWATKQLATGALDPAAAHTQFALQLPIVPLMFRAVKLWHRTDVRGLTFDALGRPAYADLYLFGEPTKTRGSR